MGGAEEGGRRKREGGREGIRDGGGKTEREGERKKGRGQQKRRTKTETEDNGSLSNFNIPHLPRQTW